ncbi:hypothetical protein N7488_000206 [Penicillium malachiteum]|nr:hypothetical protein N7488_000206 [Penicillium malachiteum]
MHFAKSLMLLAAISSSALARHEGHGRRHSGHGHEHAIRDVEEDITTYTVTTLITVTTCPCSSTTAVALTSSTPVEVISTPTPTPEEPTTSATPTPTPEETSTSSTPTPTPEQTTSSAEPTSSAESTSTVAATSTTAVASGTSTGYCADWTSVPTDGVYSTDGFGASTNATGSGDTYEGNVGSPYGSNIITVDGDKASGYKYVVMFQGSNSADWEVVIWNKYAEDGTDSGWFGNACHTFTIGAGETVYYAFDTDSQGGWAAAETSVPTNDYGEYASTWGEFDFGSSVNEGWSGFDVSAIVAQDSDMSVQGMKICSHHTSDTCSSITTGAGTVDNAYTSSEADEGGIGGNLSAGAVRLSVVLDYDS